MTDISMDMRSQLEDLIRLEYEKFYSVVYRITETHQDTEDVLQNSFMKAFRNIEKFKGKSKLSTWVYRIAINESYRFMKTLSKLPVVSITDDLNMTEEVFFQSLEYEQSMDDELIVEEIREKCIHGILNCVSKKMRVCFLLKTYTGLKNKDIAEVLEVTEGNVKTMLHRARKQLKEMFEMRCSLIDPQKPCKCHLWIKYMKDHDLPIPEGHKVYKKKELLTMHYKNMSALEKIHYLYQVDNAIDKESFLKNLKEVSGIL